MNPIKVLNVGQADCFIINPINNCIYSNKDIFIDVGDGLVRDVFLLKGNKKIIVLLSHAHMDHIGGLSTLIAKYINLLEEIWVPLYYEEIIKITGFILKLKGINNIISNNVNAIKSKNALQSSTALIDLVNILGKPVKGLREEDELCDHIKIFNPPIHIEHILNKPLAEINRYNNQLRANNYEEYRKWFNERDFLEVRNYIYGEYQRDLNINGEYDYRFFIMGLFSALHDDINKFINNPNNVNFNRIYKKIKLISNDTSVVLKYNCKGYSVLFTGDAGKKVLKRIVDTWENDISSTILKIPHHGSKYNMSNYILKKIKPQYAIISHDNHRFGKQVDPHPNMELISMLDKLKIKTLYTNDVEKNNIVIRNKPNQINVHPLINYYDR